MTKTRKKNGELAKCCSVTKSFSIFPHCLSSQQEHSSCKVLLNKTEENTIYNNGTKPKTKKNVRQNLENKERLQKKGQDECKKGETRMYSVLLLT